MTSDARGAVLFDLDGTLVDTNYQHGLAWYRAFRAREIVLPLWRIHRHIGMGGDQIVRALIGDDGEAAHGDALRASQAELFEPYLDEVSPFEGAHDLLVELAGRGHEIVLASSSPEHYLDRYLALLEAGELVSSWTTAADVEATKPAPDLLQVAMQKARTRAIAMVGDSPWDIAAARRVDLPCIALLMGGYSERELKDAGAEEVFPSLVELHGHLEETALDRPAR